MKLVTFTTALALWLITGICAQAQEVETNGQSAVEQLHALKEIVIQEEKEALRTTVENINKRLEFGNISEAEAETLKQEAAEKHALNIENKMAILENKIALLERNGADTTQRAGTRIVFGLGQEDLDNDRIFGFKVQNNNTRNKKRKYDRRTSSGFVFAFGLNNAITEGESLNDSDFRVAGSRFVELGWAWKTRVFKNSNWVRLKYGVSFQFNGLKPTDNRFFVDTGTQTELQAYPLDLDKSKFRMDNLVVPIHFEFGPSKKHEHEDYFRYSTDNQITVGLGGYAGINLGARQKLKFEEDGEDKKLKLKAGYNTNNFIYGLSGYIGWGGLALYAKYDLNTIFKDSPEEQRNISLGLRFDLD